jgi:hypothetical protein
VPVLLPEEGLAEDQVVEPLHEGELLGRVSGSVSQLMIPSSDWALGSHVRFQPQWWIAWPLGPEGL